MSKVTARALGIALCDAFGIDKTGVTRVAVVADMTDAAAKVEVTRFCCDSAIGVIGHVLEEFSAIRTETPSEEEPCDGSDTATTAGK